MDNSKTGEEQMNKLIKKENIKLWLNEIIKKYKVIAPYKLETGDFGFKPISNADEITLDYINPVISPVKQILFPAREVMLHYKKKGDSWEVELPKETDEKVVLFGIRSCDLSAMLFLDKFFMEGFVDNYYKSRRDNLITVNITCTEPADWCFCVCADCGPSKEEGFDLQLTEINDNYLVEIGSPAGKELVNIDYFKEAEESNLKEKERLVEETKNNKFKMPTTYFSKAIQNITANSIDKELWDKLGGRCLGCGSCSFVCPTCSCFNVIDEGEDSKGKRVRSWDSCMYCGFTRETSGYNPRKAPGDRVKRRYYHKLSYYYLTKMGSCGCVGCGRCIVSCLGGIDMPMVVKAVRRGKV